MTSRGRRRRTDRRVSARRAPRQRRPDGPIVRPGCRVPGRARRREPRRPPGRHREDQSSVDRPGRHRAKVPWPAEQVGAHASWPALLSRASEMSYGLRSRIRTAPAVHGLTASPSRHPVADVRRRTDDDRSRCTPRRRSIVTSPTAHMPVGHGPSSASGTTPTPSGRRYAWRPVVRTTASRRSSASTPANHRRWRTSSSDTVSVNFTSRATTR